MSQQNFANHTRLVKGYHLVLTAFLSLGIIGSLINLWLQIIAKDNIFSAALIVVLFICGLFLFVFVRQFPMKAQDRAIRAEENLRYFILTRKALDSRITIKQVIALRFAPDDEFVVLADRTINESLSPEEIKKAIKNWKADDLRV